MNEYGKSAAVRKLAVSALLLALDVVFTRVIAINTNIVKIGLGFTAIAVCAMLYGPLQAAIVSALGDLIGSLMFPTGAYFPGFTVTAALTGLIFGFCLYKAKPGWTRAILAAALNSIIVSFLANTAMIAIFFSSTAFDVLLKARLIQLAFNIVFQSIVIRFITQSPQIIAVIRSHSEKAPDEK